MDNQEKLIKELNKDINKQMNLILKLFNDVMYEIKSNGLTKAINRIQEKKDEKNNTTRI